MTEILIYGIVGDSWDGLDAKTLVPLISEGDDELVIRINSPGGYVMEGLAIYNAIVREQNKGRSIEVHIDGLCASMASVIAMAGEKIIMADNALMMIHNPWDCACGDAAELRRQADKLDLIRDQLVGIYSGQTGLSAEELIPMLDAETWLSAEQALDQKFITEIAPALQMAACDIKAFGFRKAPDSPLITAMGMSSKRAAVPAPQSKETPMNLYETRAALVAAIAKFQKDGGTQAEIDKISQSAVALEALDVLPATGALAAAPAAAPAPATPVAQVAPAPGATLTAADVTAAVAAERTRVADIRALGDRHGMDAAFIATLVNSDTAVAVAREKILDKLAEGSQQAQVGFNGPARITQDERDKWREGATNWLLVRAGVAPMVEAAAKLRGETIRIDAGEFRGMSNVQLAMEAMDRAGIRATSRDRYAIVGDALTVRAAITQTTSDFPILFENVIHRTLQAAYATTPDTWSRFCGKGTVTDFRDHTRYLRGSFGALDSYGEAGEIKNKAIPDLAKEKIKAGKKGNIINLSRDAIVNDDMDVFSGFAVDLGRAGKLTVEVEVYAVLNSNPVMNDNIALFHASHGNLRTGAAPSVASFDAIDVAMGTQTDISGNEVLDISPKVLLVPRGLGLAARVINDSPYDPDASNKLQKPNPVAKMFDDVIATARLTGTAYYAFADPGVAPALEVVFLDGNEEPIVDSKEGWRVDGVEWRVRHYFGVGAVNYRSAQKNPGA